MRNIDVATEAASEAAVIEPVFFVKLAFDAGDVNFHSRIGDITWGGDTYTGTGALGGIDRIEEDSELARTPVSMTLSGLPTTLIAALLTENYQGRLATIYIGYFDTTTKQLVADPIILYRGLMDTPTFAQGSTLSITLSVESRFAQWDRPLSRRYNNADQQGFFPGDTGMSFVEQSTEKQIAWGQPL
jgi:hypothetical protein